MKLLLSVSDWFDSPCARLLTLVIIGLMVLIALICYLIKILYSEATAHEEKIEMDSLEKNLKDSSFDGSQED